MGISTLRAVQKVPSNALHLRALSRPGYRWLEPAKESPQTKSRTFITNTQPDALRPLLSLCEAAAARNSQTGRRDEQKLGESIELDENGS